MRPLNTYKKGNAQPASILQDPQMMRLRNQLSDVSYKAIKVARDAARGKTNSRYDHTHPEYLKLAEERDQIIHKIIRLWNSL